MSDTMVFFGDSICAGYRAQPGQGWVERLAGQMPDIRAVNSGVSGETTSDALRRFEPAVAVHKPAVVYIQFGLNDASWWCRQVGRPWLTEQEYILNMVDIVARSVQCGAREVFVATNHPVMQSAPEVEGAPSYPAVVRQYNEALRRQFQTASEAVNVLLIDMETAITSNGQPPAQFLDPDGVHLSEAGNVFYAQTVGGILMNRLQKREQGSAD